APRPARLRRPHRRSRAVHHGDPGDRLRRRRDAEELEPDRRGPALRLADAGRGFAAAGRRNPERRQSDRVPLLQLLMKPTRYIAGSIIGALLLLGAAGAIDFVVDPFQQYREPTLYHARFYRSFQRHENPGIARNYAFDRAVVGSSFFENISAS